MSSNIPLILYHANCADGFGAAFAAWKQYGTDGAEYRAIAYGDTITPEEVSGREVYILDFSFPRDVMEMIVANAADTIWLDHHKSAFEMWTGNWYKGKQHFQSSEKLHVRLDDSKSGAMIAWEYFVSDKPTEIPILIQMLDDYDRWVFAIEGTKEFQKALWSLTPWDFDQWNDMLFDEIIEVMVREGAAILRAHDQNVAGVVEAASTSCDIPGFESMPTQAGSQFNIHQPSVPDMMTYPVLYQGLAANCPKHLASDVGHKLATTCGTYGLCWYQQSDGRINVSLRSNGDYDVTVIAKMFGGGGHKNAAGFTTSMSVLQSWRGKPA